MTIHHRGADRALDRERALDLRDQSSLATRQICDQSPPRRDSIGLLCHERFEHDSILERLPLVAGRERRGDTRLGSSLIVRLSFTCCLSEGFHDCPVVALPYVR